MKTNLGEDRPERAPVEAGVIVKLGLDVHTAQIPLCRQNDGRLPQSAQQCTWAEVVRLAVELRQSGGTVHSCYEAGPYGYGLHRQLTALGAMNHVVAPQQLGEHGRPVMTDKRDARELCSRLDRYVRGNTDAFALVQIPTPE